MRLFFLTLFTIICNTSFTQCEWENMGLTEVIAGDSRVTTAMAMSSNGTPHVAYGDNTQSGNIVVKRFVGNAWEQIGGVVSLTSHGNGNESFSIALDSSDVPHVVFCNTTGSINIRKFNGTSWVGVGSSFSSDNSYHCDIVIDSNNEMYISYRDGQNNNQLTVRKYNETANTWSNLVSTAVSGTIFNSNICVDSNNTVYVAYRDITAGGKVSVKKFVNNTWSTVGPSYSVGSENVAFLRMVISPNGNPYIVYQDLTLGKKASVKKFNGNTWEVVGQPGFTDNEAYNTDIAIDAVGTPYVSFADAENGNKLSVMKFDGESWISVGTEGFSSGAVVDLGRPSTSIVTDFYGAVYVAYCNEGFVAAKKIRTSNLTQHQNVCAVDLPYVWNGNSYSTSGIYQYSTTNAFGCDSIVNLYLEVNQITAGLDVQISCGEFLWIDGNIYTESNYSATHTLTGLNGCDSIITLNLTVNQPTTGIDIQTACGSYMWIDGITYIENNNTATYVLANSYGCDSIVTLNLTINQPITGTDVITACGSHTWIDGVTYTSNNNTATHTLMGSNGCDSVVILNLIVQSLSMYTDTQQSCDVFSWIDGNSYTSSNNTATHTIQGGALNGCDSIVTLNLTIVDINTDVTNYGLSLQANHSDADLYEWIDCATEDIVFVGRHFFPSFNGSYKVRITFQGCQKISSCYNVEELNIEAVSIDNLIIYPNPTKEFLFINNENVELVRIISISGQEMLKVSKSNTINVSNLDVGCYFIEVNGRKFKMFIKE